MLITLGQAFDISGTKLCKMSKWEGQKQFNWNISAKSNLDEFIFSGTESTYAIDICKVEFVAY